jgi:catechol 2,3-dioxygenase-like lactoylglutathione lyase family enzyme
VRRRARRADPIGAVPFLSFVSLGVGDLDRAVRFYRDALGGPASRITAEMALFDAGPVRLALLARPALARAAGVPDLTAAPGGILLSLNVPRREDVAALLARARSAGGRLVQEASKASWGGEAGVFADPDGFLWEIAWNPRLTRPDRAGQRRGGGRRRLGRTGSGRPRRSRRTARRSRTTA